MLVGGQLRRILPCIDTVLEPLDKFQVHILREVGLTVEEVFLQFNAALLRTRRDIAMLALICKCAHGLARESGRNGTQDFAGGRTSEGWLQRRAGKSMQSSGAGVLIRHGIWWDNTKLTYLACWRATLGNSETVISVRDFLSTYEKIPAADVNI